MKAERISSRSRSRSPLRGRRNDSLSNRRGGERSGNRIDHKSDKMVYLSNLPWELKWMELKDIIREKAGEVNFVEMLEDRDGRSKGCAVVEFKHRDGANKCIDNMHRTELHDRLIIAKEIRDPIAFFRKVREDTGIDFLGGSNRPERTRGSGSSFDRNAVSSSLSINESETFGLSPSFLRQLGIGTPLCNRVFVTNIPYNCTVGRLFDICALAGKVTWMDLQMDKEGKTKGMAVCEYSHPIEAVQAVSMLNGQRLFDRTLAVRMDRYPKDIERRDPGGLPFGLRGVGMGLGANGAPLTDVASVISNMSSSSVSTSLNGNTVAPIPTPLLATPAVAPTPLNSWVGAQIPLQQVLQQVLPQQEQQSGHFQTNYFGGQSSGQSLPSLAQTVGQSRLTPGLFGSATSQYSSKTSPNFSSQSQQKFEYGNSSGFGSLGNSSQSGGYEASRIILIKNLPVDYTWQIVSDRVQQFGDLESVEMITPGVAKVRFVQLKDAERAKSALQGTTVEGRMINIEYL